MTHASRDTSTGLRFEEKIRIDRKDGINISKKRFCTFFKEKGIDVLDYLSWCFEPDEAYYLPKTNEIVIYEKKFQQTSGSVDEKLGACAWKIQEYRALCEAASISNVSYIYCFCSWFKNKRYEKLLKFIRNTNGCDYFFKEAA